MNSESMIFKKTFIVLVSAILILGACKREPSSVNIEQVNSTKARYIIAPGMMSIGLIRDQLVYVYYLNENYEWSLDKNSQFNIPTSNTGLLGMGMGTIAVRHKDALYFYNMDPSLNWIENYELVMPLPSGYKKISSMRMAWQRGVVAVEDQNGVIRFYYLDDNLIWQVDETAAFVIPEGVESYVMIGGMEIGIISDRKLGIYQLELSGNWRFRDDMILVLPHDTEAVLSFEPGVVAVLTTENIIKFYEPDYENGYWVYDDTMDFIIPQE
jgi:hypothetical protein